MSILNMYKFGTKDDELCKLSWWHNSKGSKDFHCFSFDSPALEEGYFSRYETMQEQNRWLAEGTRLAYLDNDAVHFRRNVKLEPNLGRHACIGAVRTDSKVWPFNCGALYAVVSPELSDFLTRLLAHREDCLKIGDQHADEHAFARAWRETPELVAELDPAWNDWSRATGERKMPSVVLSFHSMPALQKYETVKATVELSQTTWPI